MARLKMCRICLQDYVQLICIKNTNLQDVYQKLTSLPLKAEDLRPLEVCYVCFALLRKSYSLMVNCKLAEEWFAKMFAGSRCSKPTMEGINLSTVLISPLIVGFKTCDEVVDQDVEQDTTINGDTEDTNKDIIDLDELKMETISEAEDNVEDEKDLSIEIGLKHDDIFVENIQFHDTDVEREDSGDEEIWISPLLSVLDIPISSGDNLSDSSSLNKPAEETSVGLITDDQDLDEATTSIVKRNTAGSDVTDELLPKVSSNGHKTTRRKTVKDIKVFRKSSDVYNDEIEDGDFSPTDGSNYISDSCDKSQNARKKSTKPSKSASKRSWDRRNCCPYCENLVTNFTRHIMRNHGDEIEVQKVMAINDPDPRIQKKKRQAVTDNLRNRGNCIHNSNVVSNNKGCLIPTRRNGNEELGQSSSGFVICSKCLGTYRRSTFYRHSKKCISNGDNMTTHALAKHALSIIPTFVHTSKEFNQKILSRLRNDEISDIVKRDPLIIAYGCRLLKKKKVKRSRKLIISKMRDLAKLLKIVRDKYPEIVQLKTLIDPKYFKCFKEAAKVMSGFNEETGHVKVSIRTRIRPQILGCIDILFTNTIMDRHKSTVLNEHIKNKLNEFKLLLEADW